MNSLKIVGAFLLGIALASAYSTVRTHERASEVRVWSEVAFDEGRQSCWLAAGTVVDGNRKFVVDAVVHAHNGAWDRW